MDAVSDKNIEESELGPPVPSSHQSVDQNKADVEREKSSSDLTSTLGNVAIVASIMEELVSIKTMLATIVAGQARHMVINPYAD